ncbi:Uncharacterised protein [Klebsiella pneumoniae]|nr:Uncharacterised protein [Klebsiella pneumoniae]
MIGAQPYLREIGKQDFKINIPGQQAKLLPGARMCFPAAKSDIDFTANNRIQRIVIPVTQADQRLRIALVNPLRKRIEEDHQQRRLCRQLKL